MSLVIRIKSKVKKLFHLMGFDLIQVKDNFQIKLYHSIYNDEILDKKPFYNIGAGSFKHPFWTNVDFASDWYKGVQKNFIHHDLMSKKPLPINTESAKIIYTSHTIEHLKEDAVSYFFKDAYRCLEHGGVFRVTTGPDADTDFRALMNGDSKWFYWDEYYEKPGTFEGIYKFPATSRPLNERWLHHFVSQLAPNDLSESNIKFDSSDISSLIEEKGFPHVLDYFCSFCEFQPDRPGNHISWWNHEKLEFYLKEAGFKYVYRSGFGQSTSVILRNTLMFDNTHPQMSIYFEAVK